MGMYPASVLALSVFASQIQVLTEGVRSKPSREKAILENPQIFQNCEIINILSAEYAQSERGAHFKSSRRGAQRLFFLHRNVLLIMVY